MFLHVLLQGFVVLLRLLVFLQQIRPLPLAMKHRLFVCLQLFFGKLDHFGQPRHKLILLVSQLEFLIQEIIFDLVQNVAQLD